MSLREQVIQRVYDECADFAERAHLPSGAEPVVAAWVWNMLAGDWKEGHFPVFVLRRDEHCIVWRQAKHLNSGRILRVGVKWNSRGQE